MVRKTTAQVLSACNASKGFQIAVCVMELENIADAIRMERLRISDHADEEAEADGLTFDEVYFSVLHGEIIESYPTDRPFPSCLIFGKTFGGDPVHSVWAYNTGNKWAVLITVYRPDPDRWINWRERKKP